MADETVAVAAVPNKRRGRKAVHGPDGPSQIFTLRTEKGWSQKQLMDKAHVSYNTIAFAERGKTLSRKTAEVLSRVLDADIRPLKKARKERVLSPEAIARAEERRAAKEAKAVAAAVAAAAAAVQASTSSLAPLSVEVIQDVVVEDGPVVHGSLDPKVEDAILG